MTDCVAAVFHGEPGKISLQRLPIPEPGRGEVLVRVLGCTICASDFHSFHGRRTTPVPTVLGHEIVGEIVRFGDPAPTIDLAGRELRRGDRITWAIIANCGDCDFCERELPQKCVRGIKYGHEPFRPGRELLGGLAEYCLLVSNTAIVRIPDELPLDVVCASSCATATVVAALEAAGELTGRSVCLSGAGMLGLTACAMARAKGAAKVVAVDLVPSRRDLSLQFGATRTCAPGEIALVAQDENGAAGFDVFVELTGYVDAFQSVWPLVRTGGTIVLVGSVFPGPAVPMFLEQIVRRHLTIKGIHNYAPRHLLAAVDFLSSNHHCVPFARLVSQWWSLDSIADAFLQGDPSTCIRIGVRPGSPSADVAKI